ncbi:MAG: hypothetical protein QMB94_01585 [Phycisphaerales bacterium]
MRQSDGISRCTVGFMVATLVPLLMTIATAGPDQPDDENSYDAWTKLFSVMNSE